MGIHQLLYPLTLFARMDMRFLSYFVSPVLGTITLTVALVLAYAYLVGRVHTLTQALLITSLAFMLGSKVVNETYLYMLIPLLALELAEHPSETKEFVFKLLYGLPLAFAFVNVPIIYIVFPLYRYFWQGPYPLTFAWAQAFPVKEHAIVLTLLAFAFIVASIYAAIVMIKEGKDVQSVAAAY